MGYVWKSPGDAGRLSMIDIEEIHIDHVHYQREVPSKNRVVQLAHKFNWTAFGSLIVMKREDESLWLVDGQHRYLAAKTRGVSKVPCMIYASTGWHQEALAFLELNVSRKSVLPTHKFLAAANAEVEPEVSIQRWLVSQGMEVAATKRSYSASNSIGYPSELISSWLRDTDVCKRAVLLQREIDPDSTPNIHVHRGLAYLLSDGKTAEQLLPSKLSEQGGVPALIKSITSFKILSGIASRSARVCAEGILIVRNHRMQHKLRLTRERQAEH